MEITVTDVAKNNFLGIGMGKVSDTDVPSTITLSDFKLVKKQ